MNTKNICDLKSCYLCLHCLPAWIPAVQGNRKVFHLVKGELLFEEQESVTGMYFVYSGLIKVHKQWGADKELILRFAQKGDIVGHRGIGADGNYPISATALQKSTVCFIDLNFFNDSLQVDPALTLDLLNFFAKELKTSEQRMTNLVNMPVKTRIVQALLTLEEKFGITDTGALNVEISRQDFSSYIGATYETTFRMLNELADEELIKMNKKEIVIVNIANLKGY